MTSASGVATAGRRRRAAGEPAHVRPGRRRRRRHLGRQAGGLRQRDHARRRRHLGRHRPRPGRPAADEAPARHEGRPLPGDDPDGRRRHDRRRRRLDRLRRPGRHLPRRPALRRRRSRARPPTAAAASSRPAPTRWSTSAGCCRRHSSAGRWSCAASSRAQAFEQGPAQALGMSVEEASMGAVQILTHSMVQSIEENSVRKGYDPRDFALVAEGGAGPLFAAQIALEVGTPWVLVPPHPGITSAHGPARDGHGLRVRLDGLPAALAARRGGAPAPVRGARGAGARPARGGRHPAPRAW